MSENIARVGRRIRELREARLWTQGDLASQLGRTQTAVSYWEAGKRAPGVDDILELAELFDVDAAELLPRPTRSLRAVLRAVAEDVDAGNLARELEQFADEAERKATPDVRFRVPAGTPRDTAESLLSAAGVKDAPVPVVDLADGCGVRILPWPFEDIDGLVVQLDDGGVIGVNKSQHRNRRRFTIAHELGHHLLRHDETFHVDFAGELSPTTTGQHPNYNWQHERAANDFAANLLMPASLVRDAVREHGDISAVAEQFQVSSAAMGFRMKNLRIPLSRDQ